MNMILTGLLKPDFIFFGESIPEIAMKKSIEEAEKADLFLVIGTTGEIMPASMIPYEAKKNKAKIENLLYFKYLLSKNPIKKKNGIKFVPKIPEATGSILYIDDQWDQGWSDIFHKYFSKIDKVLTFFA